ncbi:MAG: tRNA lysidine(34) synthetase TilS [Myxococcota bacterium]
MLRRAGPVLVGCSGGGDSVALLVILAQLASERALALSVVTVDHGLRPESRGEAAFVARLAGSLGLDHATLEVRVPQGASLQAGARRARYAALRAHARDRGARYVAVGHTRDDQAETVLFRALRGAGIEGLAGIAPARADGVVRPLLDCRRGALRAFLERRGVRYLDDPSNADPRFARTQLRALWPSLEALDPRATEHLATLADDARGARASLASRARRWQVRAERPGGLRLSVLRAMAPATRRRVLARWSRGATGRVPRREHLMALERAALSGRGEVLLGGGWAASPGGQVLRLHRARGRTRSHASPSEAPELPQDPSR